LFAAGYADYIVMVVLEKHFVPLWRSSISFASRMFRLMWFMLL